MWGACSFSGTGIGKSLHLSWQQCVLSTQCQAPWSVLDLGNQRLGYCTCGAHILGGRWEMCLPTAGVHEETTPQTLLASWSATNPFPNRRKDLAGWFGSSLHCVELIQRFHAGGGEWDLPSFFSTWISRNSPLVECRHSKDSSSQEGSPRAQLRKRKLHTHLGTDINLHLPALPPSLRRWQWGYFSFPFIMLCTLFSSESKT